jgi:hypothetical protein
VQDVLVVPDKKTPIYSYNDGNVELLSPSLTNGLDDLKHNHYCRKMIGYLEAFSRKAEFIMDTDDDTYLSHTIGVLDHREHQQRLVVSDGSPFINVFSLRLGELDIWPRGFPLDEVNVDNRISFIEIDQSVPLAVVQFLINGDTDVDAIQRLVFGVKDVKFPVTSKVDIIGDGDFCPFNSQLTLWARPAFPLMYLPSTVTFRFTDILRGIVSKRVMDANKLVMGFSDSIGHQIRNEHDLMLDFSSEIPCYLDTKKAWDCLYGLEQGSVEKGIRESYMRLVTEGICHEDELRFLDSWLKSLNRLDTDEQI